MLRRNFHQKRVRFNSSDNQTNTFVVPTRSPPTAKSTRNCENAAITQTNTFHIGEYCKQCGAIRIGPSVDTGCQNCLVPKPNKRSVHKKSEFLSRSSEHLNCPPLHQSRPISTSSELIANIENEIDIDNEAVIPKILKEINYASKLVYTEVVDKSLSNDEDGDDGGENQFNFVKKQFKLDNQVITSRLITQDTINTTTEANNQLSFKSKLISPMPIKTRKSSQNSTNSDYSCRSCKGCLRPGDSAICAEDIDPDAFWHPGCFACSVCQEILVDLTYFTKNRKIFCEKHYQELKVCAACVNAIESREYISAENKYWHLEHFTCTHCGLSLGNSKYLTTTDKKDGSSLIFCFRCHEQLYPKFCITCQERIAPDELKFTYENLNWHSDPFCFKCEFCSKDLLECHFLIKRNRLFCGMECKRKLLLK